MCLFITCVHYIHHLAIEPCTTITVNCKMSALFFVGAHKKPHQWLNVILLCCAVFDVVYSGTIYVTPGSKSLCPKDALPCETLDEYITGSNGSFITSNTTVILLNGTHLLSTALEVRNCDYVRITGITNSVSPYDNNSLPDVFIKCAAVKPCGLKFVNSREIEIENIGFDSCGAKVQSCDSFAALYFQHAENVSLFKTIINNTNGYGLLIENVIGEVLVKESTFTRATKNAPQEMHGNAKFRYGNLGDVGCQNSSEITKISIHSSKFMDGGDGVSGIQITLGCPNVFVQIEKANIRNNKGGNLVLNVTDFGGKLNTSIIKIVDSHIDHGTAIKGGGMRFWSRTYDSSAFVCTSCDAHTMLEVHNTTFHSNHAHSTGGAVYIKHYQGGKHDCFVKKILFLNCKLVRNFGNYSAAIEISKHLILADYSPPPLKVYFTSCKFFYNSARNKGLIVNIKASHVTISNSTFFGSNGTAISLQMSTLNLYGDNCFEGNHAEYGGALKVCERSFVYIHSYSRIRFINNTARMGGAIFIERECMDTLLPCVFQPHLPSNMSIEEISRLLSLDFVNNHGSVAGDAVYGGAFDQCYTIGKYFYNGQLSSNFLHILNATFNISTQSPSSISSNPRGVCFCNKSVPRYINTCQTQHPIVKVYPGESFSIFAVTVGQLNGSTIGTIQSSLQDEGNDHKLLTVSGGTCSNNCTQLNYTMLSNRSNATVTLSVSQSAESYGNAFTVDFSIEILKCPLGFVLDSLYSCSCSNLFYHRPNYRYLSYPEVECDINTRSIRIERPMWFGCQNASLDDVNISSNCNTLVVSNDCDYYCSEFYQNVSTSNRDEQCLPGHTGTLCGACKPGLSRLSGLNRCENCTNSSLLWYIPLTLASGVFIVLVLTILNLTITEGTLNGLLIYATDLYGQYSYFSHSSSIKLSNILWTFVAWLNLDSGFYFCVYNGMTAYTQIWLKFGYAFYLLLIQILIVLLSRKSIFFTRLCGRNVVKVLATLLCLTQSRLMYACFNTFQYATLYSYTQQESIKHSTVWYYDGNVRFFGTKHTLLLIVAIFCSVIALWFNFSLLCIQCLERGSRHFCLRWVNKLRPLFDAYSGPCNDNYRFWPGLVFAIRALLSAISMYISRYNRSFLHFRMIFTAVLCVLFLILACIFPRGVYKKWSLNVLEFSFLLNLCILSIYLVFARNHDGGNAITISTFLVAVTFIGIIAYHIYLQIKGMRGWNYIQKFFSNCARKFKRNASNRHGEHDVLLPQPLPATVHFGEYREPLIDD